MKYHSRIIKLFLIFLLLALILTIFFHLFKVHSWDIILSFIPNKILIFKATIFISAIFFSFGLISLILIIYAINFPIRNKILGIDIESLGDRFGRNLSKRLRKQSIILLFSLLSLIIAVNLLLGPLNTGAETIWASALALIAFLSLMVNILVLQRVEKPISTMDDYIDTLIELIDTANAGDTVTIYCATHNPGQRDASGYIHENDYKMGVEWKEGTKYKDYYHSMIGIDSKVNLEIALLNYDSLMEFKKENEDNQKQTLINTIGKISDECESQEDWQPNTMLEFLIKFAINDKKKLYPTNLKDTDIYRLNNLRRYLIESAELLEKLNNKNNVTIKELKKFPKVVIAFNNRKAIFALIYFPRIHELIIQGVEILDKTHINGLRELYKDIID